MAFLPHCPGNMICDFKIFFIKTNKGLPINCGLQLGAGWTWSCRFPGLDLCVLAPFHMLTPWHWNHALSCLLLLSLQWVHSSLLAHLLSSLACKGTERDGKGEGEGEIILKREQASKHFTAHMFCGPDSVEFHSEWSLLLSVRHLCLFGRARFLKHACWLCLRV